MIVQLCLAAFGLTSLWMAMGDNAVMRRWAPVVGLCGQPFWLLFAIDSQAWGVIALVCAYTFVYVRGTWVQWRPRPAIRHRNSFFANRDVVLDGSDFEECTFTGCHLFYSGGPLPRLVNNTMDARCTWHFSGAAAHTTVFMQALYHSGGSDLIESTFKNIRQPVTAAEEPR